MWFTQREAQTALDIQASAWKHEVARLEGQLRDERARYDALLAEVLRRGLKDEKELTPQAPDDKPLPTAILKALGQWPEGSAPYIQNRNYAFAQLAVRPDDADAIAAEINAGEDIEAFV